MASAPPPPQQRTGASPRKKPLSCQQGGGIGGLAAPAAVPHWAQPAPPPVTRHVERRRDDATTGKVGGRAGRAHAPPRRSAVEPRHGGARLVRFFFLCVFFLTCDCGRGLPAKLSHRGTSWAGPAPPVPPHPLLYTTSEALTWSPDRQTGGAAAGRGFGGACKREGPLNGEEYSSQCVGGGTRRAAGGGLGARPAGLLGWGGAPKNLVRAPRQRGTEVVGQHASPSPPSQRPQRLPPRVQPHWCRSRAGRARLRRRLCCFPARRGGGDPHVVAWMVLFLSPRCVLSGVPLYVSTWARAGPARGTPHAAHRWRQGRSLVRRGSLHGPRPGSKRSTAVQARRDDPPLPSSASFQASTGGCGSPSRCAQRGGGGTCRLEGPRWPHREVPCPHPLLLPEVPTGFQPGHPPSLTERGVLAEVQHTLWVLCS